MLYKMLKWICFSIAWLWLILQSTRQSIVLMIKWSWSCILSVASCRWSPSVCRDSALSDRHPPAGRESCTTLDSTQHWVGKAGWVGGQMQSRPETSVLIPAWIKAQPLNITVTLICATSLSTILLYEYFHKSYRFEILRLERQISDEYWTSLQRQSIVRILSQESATVAS